MDFFSQDLVRLPLRPIEYQRENDTRVELPVRSLSSKFHSAPLRFLTLFFRSYLCLIGPFNYRISLSECLLQLWYNPFVVDWA